MDCNQKVIQGNKWLALLKNSGYKNCVFTPCAEFGQISAEFWNPNF